MVGFMLVGKTENADSEPKEAKEGTLNDEIMDEIAVNLGEEEIELDPSTEKYMKHFSAEEIQTENADS